MNILQPPDWKPAKGYSNGISASGEVISVSGQIGWTEDATLVSDDFVPQVKQALANVVSVLQQGGAKPDNLVRLTWYLTNFDEYRGSLKEIGQVYREIVGNHYPAMSVVQVSALLEPGAKVEIEATAIK